MLAAAWVGACDADDTGLFSNDAPLSPTGGSDGRGMAVTAGTAGTGASSPSMPAAGSGGEPVPSGGGGTGSDPVEPDDDDEPPPELPDDAPEVELDDGNCEAFVPCGGALSGSWVFSDGCIDEEDLGLQLSADGCENASASIEATISGGLRFSGNTVERQGTGRGTGVLRLPNVCTLAIASCPGLRALIDNDEDRCEQGGVDCLCNFATEELEWDEDTYQASGNTFTLGSGRTFDYCVEGDTLTYRETTDGASPQDAALHVLTRQ